VLPVPPSFLHQKAFLELEAEITADLERDSEGRALFSLFSFFRRVMVRKDMRARWSSLRSVRTLAGRRRQGVLISSFPFFTFFFPPKNTPS